MYAALGMAARRVSTLLTQCACSCICAKAPPCIQNIEHAWVTCAGGGSPGDSQWQAGGLLPASDSPGVSQALCAWCSCSACQLMLATPLGPACVLACCPSVVCCTALRTQTPGTTHSAAQKPTADARSVLLTQTRMPAGGWCSCWAPSVHPWCCPRARPWPHLRCSTPSGAPGSKQVRGRASESVSSSLRLHVMIHGPCNAMRARSPPCGHQSPQGSLHTPCRDQEPRAVHQAAQVPGPVARTGEAPGVVAWLGVL